MKLIMNFQQLAAMVAVVCGLATLADASQLLVWNFDEATGDALDTGDPPATSGALIGGASRSTDTPSGTGFSIDLRDGADGYKYVATPGDADELDGLADFTLTTWLKLEDYPGTGSSSNARLLAKQAPGSFAGFNWSLNSSVPAESGAASASNLTMALFVGGSTAFAFDIVDDNSFDASEWTFLAVSYASATGETIYYTGGIDSPVTQYSTATINAGVTNDSDAAFGVGFTAAAPTADTSAIGWQDDVRVWGSVLDAAALDDIRVSNIPEPASIVLLGLAIASALLMRRRR